MGKIDSIRVKLDSIITQMGEEIKNAYETEAQLEINKEQMKVSFEIDIENNLTEVNLIIKGDNTVKLSYGNKSKPDMKFTFDPQKITQSSIQTPYGEINVQIITDQLIVDLDGNQQGSILIEYRMESNGVEVVKTKLIFQI